MRRDPRAVVKLGHRAQREAVGQLVRRNSHRLCDEPVHRIRLVAGPHHQRREGQIHALRAFALEDVGVERIEGVVGLIVGARRGNGRKYTALGRCDIHIVEILEVGGILEITKSRDAVHLAAILFGRTRRPERQNAQRTDTKTEHMPAR
jgi:hypothetical protein